MSSPLHRLPLEILSDIARLSAIPNNGGLPTTTANLARVDKSFHNCLALSSIFERPPSSRFDPAGDIIDPASLTHPRLWAQICKDLFSTSAITRRCFFTPSLHGYSIQLVRYCNVLRWLRNSHSLTLTYDDHDSTDNDQSQQNDILEILFLMLLDCDGKNTCQLDWAGAYEYCKRWLNIKLYPVDPATGRLANAWPRDDRYVAYALWVVWLLTTYDRLASETPEEAVYFQDLLFRFCYCSWRYPHSYAPLSRYTLPLQNDTLSSPNPLDNNAHHPHPSVASVLPYPVFRSSTSPKSRLKTTLSKVSHFGCSFSWSPPLLTNAAKLLYNCRVDSIAFLPPPILPKTRAEAQILRHRHVHDIVSANPVLGALYNLAQTHGVAAVQWMLENNQLPPDVASLPGLHHAAYHLGSITGPNGDNPLETVQLTQADMMEWNSHRETVLPFRGGWDEDGVDERNNRWWVKGSPNEQRELPRIRKIDQLGLPYECTHVSSIHDAFFWRLRMCGNPIKVEEEDDFRGLAFDQVLRSRWSRLVPGGGGSGTSWRPGLFHGLFQGTFWYPPEHWLIGSYRSNTFEVPNIGENITWGLPAGRMNFIGRFQEHHLIASSTTTATPKIVPFTCDSRTFPRNPPEQGGAPIAAFASTIDPGDELLIDEGGMNAFLPANFRCEHGTNRRGRPVARFGWGEPKGVPPPERMTEYETFVPGQPSSHDEDEGGDGDECEGCRENRNVEAMFRQVGLSPSPGSSSSSSLGDHGHLSREGHYHSPSKIGRCDGIQDIILTGETDLNHGQAWHHYHLVGRIRKWDGLACILRIPKNTTAGLPTMLFYGNFEGDLNFVGGWRQVTGDRMVNNANLATPPVYAPSAGLRGSGLMGRGGAGVLGDGLRVVHEGPFTMSKVVEREA